MKSVSHVAFAEAGDAIAIEDIGEPGAPAPGEALVEVLASPINPSDLIRLSGGYGTAAVSLPMGAGSQGVGRIVETGAEVQGIAAGDLVLLHSYFVGGGVWRARLLAPAAALHPVPEADALQLSMLNVNPPTADIMLSEFVNLEPGDWVVQNAANSSVGNYLTVLAARRGIRTIDVVRREAARPAVEAAGAAHILIDGPDLPEEVAAITGDARPKLAIDAVAGAATGRLAQCLAPGGTVVNYGLLSGEPCQIHPRDVVFRDIRLAGFWMQLWWERNSAQARSALYARLGALIAEGALHIPVEATYPLAQAKEALAHAAGFSRKGKVFLVPRE